MMNIVIMKQKTLKSKEQIYMYFYSFIFQSFLLLYQNTRFSVVFNYFKEGLIFRISQSHEMWFGLK